MIGLDLIGLHESGFSLTDLIGLDPMTASNWDWIGVGLTGMEWTVLDWTGLDWIGMDSIDWMG